MFRRSGRKPTTTPAHHLQRAPLILVLTNRHLMSACRKAMWALSSKCPKLQGKMDVQTDLHTERESHRDPWNRGRDSKPGVWTQKGFSKDIAPS